MAAVSLLPDVRKGAPGQCEIGVDRASAKKELAPFARRGPCVDSCECVGRHTTVTRFGAMFRSSDLQFDRFLDK